MSRKGMNQLNRFWRLFHSSIENLHLVQVSDVSQSRNSWLRLVAIARFSQTRKPTLKIQAVVIPTHPSAATNLSTKFHSCRWRSKLTNSRLLSDERLFQCLCRLSATKLGHCEPTFGLWVRSLLCRGQSSRSQIQKLSWPKSYQPWWQVWQARRTQNRWSARTKFWMLSRL